MPFASKARLTLWQLMVGMTGCAIYFTLSRRQLLHVPTTPWQFTLLCGLAIFHGCCWTGAVVVIQALISGPQVAIEPGVWLLCSLGIITASEWLVALLPRGNPFSAPALMESAICLALVGPTLSRRLDAGWKWLFVVLTLIEILRLATLLLVIRHGVDAPKFHAGWHVVAGLRLVAGGSLLVWLTLRDRGRAPPRSWLDRCGIVCTFIWMGLSFTFARLP